MHKKVYALLLLLFFGCIGLAARAQSDTQNADMADKLRADGKIYVVVTVLVVILAGLLLYIIRLDRKISRLEKDLPARRDS